MYRNSVFECFRPRITGMETYSNLGNSGQFFQVLPLCLRHNRYCDPGSIPRLGVICGLSLFLVLVLAPRIFSPGISVFLPPQKPTLPNSNSIWNPMATGLSVEKLFSFTLVKQSQFIILFIYLFLFIYLRKWLLLVLP